MTFSPLSIKLHHLALPALFTIAPLAGETEVPDRLDLSNFPGEVVEKVVVPIPAEIFAVLDKLDEPNWGEAVDLPAERSTGERLVMALQFGSLVAEGFIAVQARDADEIQNIGRRVLAVSESLSLADAVRPHSLSIIEAAGERDWDGVRDELDATQKTVRDTMVRLRDDEMSELVSLGGWIRGTHVVTAIISESFSEDKAELLNQPGLVVHFRERIAALDERAQALPEIRALATGLARIESIIENGVVSQEGVGDLASISESMLEEYYLTPSATPSEDQ
ncbi:MAG: hypothetical protein AAF236_08485 [Verrucomicrobiota bacterium]